MKRIISTMFFASLVVGQTHAVCLPAQTCAQVSSLVDVAFGEYDLVSPLQSIDNICAYVQDDDEINYTLTFEGSGTGNAFQLTNGVSTVDYSLALSDNLQAFQDASTGIAFTPSHANDVIADCSTGGETARVRIRIAPSDIQFKTAGTYTGTVTVTMTPD